MYEMNPYFHRRLFQSIAQFGPALGCVFLAFVGCDQTLSIVALCLSVALSGGIYSGFQVKLSLGCN